MAAHEGSREEPSLRLSTKGRYAVMAMADLANHWDGTPVCVAEIAQRQDISPQYLEQLFTKLRRAGLVYSVRGSRGGYLLARRPEEVRVAEIIVAVDEPIETVRCHAESAFGCTGARTRCLTHDLWEELGNVIRRFFDSVTLADIVERRVRGTGSPAHDIGRAAAD